jgi:hypothetical protein
MNFLFNYNDILSYYNKKINEKTKIIDLQPKSDLYNQIHNDDRLGCWHIKELKDNIYKKGNEIIENTKSIIIQETDKEKIKNYIENLKIIDNFFIKNRDEFEKELDLLHSNVKVIIDSKINPIILNNQISIFFNKRKNDSIRLKPIYFSFSLSIEKSIKVLIDRYNKVVKTNNKSNDHLHEIISSNIKQYRKNFYTKPWKYVIQHGIHKNRNESYYHNIKKIDQRIFLEIVDLLLTVVRNDNITFFNLLHLKIGQIFNNLHI